MGSLAMTMKPGLTLKSRARILTVDPVNRRIEAILKDESTAIIPLWDDLGNAYRLPIEGEIWIIRKDQGIWSLDCRVHNGQLTDTTTPAEPEALPATNLTPGQMKLDSSNITNDRGYTMVAVDLTGIQDGWTLKWNATLNRFVAGP